MGLLHFSSYQIKGLNLEKAGIRSRTLQAYYELLKNY
jgi:hypothetical protein